MVGRKPKATVLHLVDGTLNTTRHKDRVDEPQPAGKPIKPKFLRGKASKLWDEYFEIGYWLTSADSHALAIWCELTAEAERGVSKMVASRISQLRALGSELGLSGPSSRARLNVGSAVGKGKKDEDKNGKGKFFTRRSD